MPNRLKGVKAVITGGAGAIGMATAFYQDLLKVTSSLFLMKFYSSWI